MKNIISNKNNLQVLFEDNHIIAINKRCGDIVQGDKTGDKPLSEIVKSFIKSEWIEEDPISIEQAYSSDLEHNGRCIFFSQNLVHAYYYV